MQMSALSWPDSYAKPCRLGDPGRVERSQANLRMERILKRGVACWFKEATR